MIMIVAAKPFHAPDLGRQITLDHTNQLTRWLISARFAVKKARMGHREDEFRVWFECHPYATHKRFQFSNIHQHYIRNDPVEGTVASNTLRKFLLDELDTWIGG